MGYHGAHSLIFHFFGGPKSAKGGIGWKPMYMVSRTIVLNFLNILLSLDSVVQIMDSN